MSVSNYTLDKCKYIHSKLKNVLYLVSEDHVKYVHIDNGEAYISGLTETPLRINGFNIQYSEETSLDERYKFDKKITLSMKGYVNYKLFGGRYYAIVEDNDGIYYMVNVDFPSKITHTFNLSQNTNQTDFTFHSLSNFPTLKLNSEFEAENLPCLGYNVYGIDSLQLIDKNYARLDTHNKKVITTDVWKNIEYLGNSCSLQEVYDGENVTDTISFQIPLNHKIGWSWNLLEFLDNRYASIIVPKGGDNKYFSGFNFGLEPSYTIASSSNNGESDIITITLVEMSNFGLTAANDFEDEDWDTTHWRYVKYVDEIVCYECVGYARARYLVQQEVDAFGNPTGNYKVRDGYQSQYQMLNVVGTFSNDELFNDNDCTGNKCRLNTDIPSSISFSAANDCHEYSISASCDWNISDLASYLTVTRSSGDANTQYSVTICNTSSVMGQESTFNINYGSSVKVVNVILGEPSFINPTTVDINCLEQDVVFTFDASCPITVISNPYNLTYQITNSNLIVHVPRNYDESAVTYSLTVQNCNYETQELTINQDKTYVKWVSSGYMCASGNSYVKEVKYTGTTISSYSPTSEYRQGELITSGDTRCQAIKKWEFRDHYYCIDGDKYQCIEEVESYDGINWTPTWETKLGEMVESASSFCLEDVTYEWRLNNRKYQCEGDEPSVYSNQYLTFVATNSGKFKFSGTSSNSLSYSLDSGSTWTALASDTDSPTVSAGNKIMWKGTCSPTSSGIGTFSSTGKYNVEGNIMSLLYGDDFENQTSLSEKQHAFVYLFIENGNLISAENLVLPATTLSTGCYFRMFHSCSGLTTPPVLPSTTLANGCYEDMFAGCTGLITAQSILPATTIENNSYNGMFAGCSSLVTPPVICATTLNYRSCYSMFMDCTSLATAPELPATTLAEQCYEWMFVGCTSLTSVPQLPATTLANSCYRNMFVGCTSLTTPPQLPATTMAEDCYYGMFYNCSGLTTAPVLSATTLAKGCYKGMFQHCYALRTPPQLPATTLAEQCYANMFFDCTGLASAPELPATTLVDECYRVMFSGCTLLNYVKCMATDISADNCTSYWLNDVSYTGTFVKNSSMSSWTRGGSGIPSGWNVEDYNLNERWVNSGTTCSGSSGYDLYNMQAKEIYSGGNWTPTGEMRLGSLIEANSSQCLPPTPSTDFDSLLTQFNGVLSANNITQITSGGTPNTYNYLKTLNSEATSAFNNSNSDLFKKSTYAEIYDYRNGSITNHELGLSAMTSWLMAMQISEIVANSGVTTNNQTKLFKKAYEIGGGKNVPIYGYSDLRSDVSICRLAASAIYGKNKNYYDFDKIDVMRTEMGTTVNNRNSLWTDYGYSTNGESHICNNTLSVTLGFDIDFNDIFPAAAGPYATEINVGGETCNPSNPTAANRQPDPLQPSNQFNPSTKNYIVDETIDSVATSNYNLYSVTSYLPRAIQAVADDSESVNHLFAKTTYYKYNSSSPLNSFSAGTPSDNNGSFSGTFDSNVIGVDLSSSLRDEQGNETAFRDFYSGVRDMGGNSRRSLLNKQYGRRRPAQGTADNTPRCVCGNGIAGGCTNCTDSSCTRQNWLGDVSLERLIGTGTKYDSNNNPQRYYIDSNGNGYWENGEPYYGQAASGTTNLCPGTGVKAATYPSGHSSGVWTVALFLMQMIPNKWFEIYKSAYSFTVSRTIVRAHWNSDVIYGKLCASAIVPTINSFNNSEGGINFRTLYNNAKAMIDDA